MRNHDAEVNFSRVGVISTYLLKFGPFGRHCSFYGSSTVDHATTPRAVPCPSAPCTANVARCRIYISGLYRSSVSYIRNRATGVVFSIADLYFSLVVLHTNWLVQVPKNSRGGILVSEAEIKAAFDFFDVEGKGLITASTLRKRLGAFHRSLSARVRCITNRRQRQASNKLGIFFVTRVVVIRTRTLRSIHRLMCRSYARIRVFEHLSWDIQVHAIKSTVGEQTNIKGIH